MAWRRLIAAAALVGAAAAASALVLGGTGRAQDSALPGCVHPLTHVALPAALARFPLPTGTTFDDRQAKYGYTIYNGYVPGAIKPPRDLLLRRPPARGLPL